MERLSIGRRKTITWAFWATQKRHLLGKNYLVMSLQWVAKKIIRKDSQKTAKESRSYWYPYSWWKGRRQESQVPNHVFFGSVPAVFRRFLEQLAFVIRRNRSVPDGNLWSLFPSAGESEIKKELKMEFIYPNQKTTIPNTITEREKTNP